MAKKLKQALGNWVAGDRFWGREADIDLFIQRIDEGAHQTLVAQRRMGKTSLLHETARRLNDRYTCIIVDLEGAASASEAIADLSVAVQPFAGLWDKVKGVFRNALEMTDSVNISELSIKIRGDLTAGNWTKKGDQLLGILADAPKPVLLMMDEVPILVNRLLRGDDRKMTPERVAEADAFLSWLRRNSQEHQGKVRMVVTGSIGLAPLLREAGLSATMNNFTPFELAPWDKSTALGCLDALANEYGVCFEDGATEAMLRKLGCNIPHHLQVFFSCIYEDCRRRRSMACTKRDVGRIYKSEVLGVHGHLQLTHYEERLRLSLGHDAAAHALAIEMLTEAAIVGVLTTEAMEVLRDTEEAADGPLGDVQMHILGLLEHDGYLQRNSKGHVFVSRLLRDWWRKRYEGFYTPVLKRGA